MHPSPDHLTSAARLHTPQAQPLKRGMTHLFAWIRLLAAVTVRAPAAPDDFDGRVARLAAPMLAALDQIAKDNPGVDDWNQHRPYTSVEKAKPSSYVAGSDAKLCKSESGGSLLFLAVALGGCDCACCTGREYGQLLGLC